MGARRMKSDEQEALEALSYLATRIVFDSETVEKMETIRKWKDPEKIWDINHYARLCFNVKFQQDLEAKKAFDEEEKEKRKRELELKEAQSKAEKPKGK